MYQLFLNLPQNLLPWNVVPSIPTAWNKSLPGPIIFPPHLANSHSSPKGQLTFHCLLKDFSCPVAFAPLSLHLPKAPCTSVPRYLSMWQGALPSAGEQVWSVLFPTVNHPHLSQVCLYIASIQSLLEEEMTDCDFFFFHFPSRVLHGLGLYADIPEFARFST